jgi:hypothetical protein
MSAPPTRSKEDWARLALVRVRSAHAAIVAASADLGTPRPIETTTHLLEAADHVLHEWLKAAFPRR